MKATLFLFAAMFAIAISAQGQTKVKIQGNTLVNVTAQKSDTDSHSILSNSTKTNYTYHLKNGENVPVWKSSNGNYFVVRQSQKTGNLYRQYLKIESL